MNTRWAIAVHGGAREIPDEQQDAFRAGVSRAVGAGAEVLASGGSAVDAVEASVRVLEDDPTFNAGTGAVITTDGAPQYDAAIMDGATLDVGAIAAARDLRHPVTVARAALRSELVLVTGPPIEEFAREVDDGALTTRATARDGDTVGCVALDREGHLAAASSTGGLEDRPPGRIGDLPLAGAGLYAEDGLGAAAVSGDGESITRTVLASWTLLQAAGTAGHEAVDAALHRLDGVGGTGGILLLDPRGRLHWGHSTPHFAVAWACDGEEPGVAIRHDEVAP